MSLNEILKNFFDMICIKMDPKPQPWGVWHLSFLIIGIGLAIFISYKLRHASLKTFNRVLRIVGFSLIGLEVFKLMYNYYAIYDMDYNQIVFIFPFQLCSMPLYMSVIASYLREDSKVRKAMLTFMMTFSLMSGVAAYIEPSGILNSTLSFQRSIPASGISCLYSSDSSLDSQAGSVRNSVISYTPRYYLLSAA